MPEYRGRGAPSCYPISLIGTDSELRESLSSQAEVGSSLLVHYRTLGWAPVVLAAGQSASSQALSPLEEMPAAYMAVLHRKGAQILTLHPAVTQASRASPQSCCCCSVFRCRGSRCHTSPSQGVANTLPYSLAWPQCHTSALNHNAAD